MLAGPGGAVTKKSRWEKRIEQKGIDWFFLVYLANANDVILMPNDVVSTEPCSDGKVFGATKIRS